MKIYLAPMEGVLDAHFRKILTHLGGIDACVSEFIRITDQKLPKKVFTRICPEINQNGVTSNDTPVYVQLLGGNPEMMAYHAQKLALMGVKNIDLNFGCPAKSVNKNNGGAILLKQPYLIEKIVSTVKSSLPDHVHLSAKIRLGYDNKLNYLDNAMAVELGGADKIFVHARSKVDGYRPPIYWGYITKINETLNIPVVANGDIYSLDSLNRCKEITGCSEFMLGRGILQTPDLPRAIKSIQTNNYRRLIWSEVVTLIYQYYLVIKDNYHGKYIGNRIKQWLSYLRKGYLEGEAFFNSIKKLKTEDEFNLFFKENKYE